MHIFLVIIYLILYSAVGVYLFGNRPEPLGIIVTYTLMVLNLILVALWDINAKLKN